MGPAEAPYQKKHGDGLVNQMAPVGKKTFVREIQARRGRK